MPGLGAAPPRRSAIASALDLAGTWNETVRADLDENDSDGDGTEEVVARDSAVRFALRATMPDVPLRDGRVVKPHYDVAQTSLTQQAGSTFTDWDGNAGTCFPQASAATGGGTIASVGAGLVFRPSSDAVLDIECEATVHALQHLDRPVARGGLQGRPGARGGAGGRGVSRLVPGASATGGSRSRLPPPPRSGRSSAARARTRATPSPARSAWQGSVTLDRLTPAIGPARQTRGGAVQVDVRCAAACAPVLRAGAARKAFRVPAGVTRRLTLPARAARVVVTIGDERKALKVGRGR